MIHWVKSKKLRVLIDLEAGRETYETLFHKYELSEEEINEWKTKYETFGINSLRTTYTKKYRNKK